MDPIKLDCGHMSTPDGLAAGYATDPSTKRTTCYQCAADADREYARTMQPGDAPLFAYVKAVKPLPNQGTGIEVVTWPGVTLGTGYMGRPTWGGFGARVQYVSVTIDGRHFHGRHYPDSGDYVRLRPYKVKA